MAAHTRADRFMRQLDPNYTAATSDKKVFIASRTGGVAVLVLNNAPVNAFSPEVRRDLKLAYEDAIADDSVKALVITGGTGGFFMAGADIAHLQKTQKAGGTKQEMTAFIKEGNDLYNRIESGPKPVVAAVNGVALGGGLELAMCCNARIGVKKSVYGLPELSLGLIPGLGGTQRLPRLVGVKMAVGATMKGQKIPAKNALKAGLIDAIEKKPKNLIKTASAVALAIAAGQQPRRKSLFLNHKIRAWEDERMIIEGMRVKISKKAKHTPHPSAYLDAVEAGVRHGGEKGLDKEMDVFGDVLMSQTAKSLIHVFFSQRASGKVKGVPSVKSKMKTVAVLGGGTMGSGIALVYLMNGYNVIMKEVNQKYLDGAVERMVGVIMRFLKKKGLPSMGAEQIMRNFSGQLTYDNFDKCDLVVEAVLENLDLKQKIFSELEQVCNPKCILATNTSSIDIELVGAKTNALDRIIGLHFFSPAHMMPLLEIVRTPKTSAETIGASINMAKKIKKTPVVVGNCVGFTANRVFSPYGQGAGLLSDLGVDIYRIDKVIEGFGMPMGPFRMGDLSGVDIGVHVGELIGGAYPEWTYAGQLGHKLFEKKRLGQKTGAGYYKYKRNRPVPDPKGIAPFVEASRAAARAIGVPNQANFTDEEIVEVCMYPVVNESSRVIAEGHAQRPSDVDMCAIMGYGFPAWRGGVMFWAQSVGYAKVVERLQYYADTLGKDSPAVRAFFTPSAALKQLAASS